MTLFDLMEFLTVGKPSVMEKALFLCKFHRGLDATTLVDRFNFEAWEQLVKYFGSENHNSWDLDKCPVPITLVRIKVDYKHIGFLERDAIYELQKYLDFRKKQTGQDMQKGDAIFLNKFGRHITESWISESFHKISTRAGILKIIGKTAIGKNIYNMNSHEIRDLLTSVLIDCGCRDDVVEESVGHKPKNSYQKQAQLFPENMRKEYAKASRKINIFTNFASLTKGTDDADDLRLELKDKISEVGKLKEDLVMEIAIKKKDEIFAKRQFEMMQDMQKQIDKLSQKVSNPKDSQRLEFCCIGCNTVHDKQECPACGSKLKRIYEEIHSKNQV